jgi:hypothetical protein
MGAGSHGQRNKMATHLPTTDTKPKIQKGLEHIGSKRIWSISTRRGGPDQRNYTIKFINKPQVPRERFKDVTYGQFVCTEPERPEKKEKNHTRFTIGGNRINYPGEVATPTADLLVAKILFNSTISTPGAKFMTMDISDFYLNLPLPRPEYIQINISNHQQIEPTRKSN